MEPATSNSERPYAAIAEHLAELRATTKLGFRRFGKMLNLSKSVVERAESGHHRPSDPTLAAYAHHFAIAEHELKRQRDQTVPSPSSSRGRHPKPAQTVIIVGLVMLGIVAAVTRMDRAGKSHGAGACVAVGTAVAPYESFKPGFVAAYRGSGGANSLGCAINAIHQWGPGVVQDMRGGRTGVAAIMSFTLGEVHVLSGSLWSAYDAIGGTGRGTTAEIAGYPLDDPRACAGGTITHLVGGIDGPGALVGSPDGRIMWVSGAFWPRYSMLGGPTGVLGFPRTKPQAFRDGLRQDFERGWLFHRADVGTVTSAEYASGIPDASPTTLGNPTPQRAC